MTMSKVAGMGGSFCWRQFLRLRRGCAMRQRREAKGFTAKLAKDAKEWR
jgi:hypothetical protein